MNHEEMEQHMVGVFRPMESAVAQYSWTFGRGPDMHDDARAAAPEWLRKWDDDHRWLICFTQGWRGLVIMAKAFGWTKESLLDDLIHYKETYGQEVRS